MAILSSGAATLANIASQIGTDKKLELIVELLSQTNEVLEDMSFVEGNLPTGHKTVIRTGLPAVAWRMLNYGVNQSKSATQIITDSCGMLEAYAEIDKAMADLSVNGAGFRTTEDRAFLEAMNQQMAETLFYGDTAKHPERFLGLAPRFSTLDRAKAETAANVIDAGGTEDGKLSSAWLVCWGDQTVHGIYPRNSKAGFQHNDLGEVTLQDDRGGRYQGYRTHYKWDIGLTVRDWRYVVRIANIDLASISDDALIECFVQAVEALPSLKAGNPVFYMNRQMRTRLRNAMRRATNVRLAVTEAGGHPVMSFDEVPVKRCDALVNSEKRVK